MWRYNISSTHSVEWDLEQNVDGEAVLTGNLASSPGHITSSLSHGNDSSLASSHEDSYLHHTTSEFSYSDDEYADDEDCDVNMSESDGGASLYYEEGIEQQQQKSWPSAVWSMSPSMTATAGGSPASYLDNDTPVTSLFSMASPHGSDMSAADSPATATATTSQMPPPPPHADLVLGVPPFLHVPNTPASQAVLTQGHVTVANAAWYHQSANVNLFAQHLQEIQDDDEEEPINFTNLYPGVLGSVNPPLVVFLRVWARQNRYVRDHTRRDHTSRNFGAPNIVKINQLAENSVKRVEYQDLCGDKFDFQGINWEDLGVRRVEARERRLTVYKNFVNLERSDAFENFQNDPTAQPCKAGENYFRFRRMDVRQNVHLAHFQLRNMLASATRSRSYFPGRNAVMQINPLSGKTEKVMDTSNLGGGSVVSTLAAGHGMLVAGTFSGEYYVQRVDSAADAHQQERFDGQLSERASITTHVQVNESRTSSSPLAAFACNDAHLRVLDLATQRFVLEKKYDDAVNCAALSPDRRMRAMVGDHTGVLIVHADTGAVLHELEGHGDFGFACDWADDGHTLATGFQDMSVKIWDARRWKNARGESTPLCTLRTEMSGVRSMRFSPAGSGRRVLVAAEESDMVHIIDARDFSRKQTFDIFGEIGGVAFANGGRDLQVLCCDRDRGGLLQFERCDLDADPDDVERSRDTLSAAGNHEYRSRRAVNAGRHNRPPPPPRVVTDWQARPNADFFVRKPRLRGRPSTVAPF